MGKIEPFKKEKLVVGVIINEEKEEITVVKDNLEREFGTADYQSEAIPFFHTLYYEKEMGCNLQKYFFSFKNIVDPANLSDIKIKTNAVEEAFTSITGECYINIDPGLLSLSKLILASTKNYSHRIPLHKGIYGEITLIYSKKGWRALPWTYPDFQTVEYQVVLSEVRALYWQQIQAYVAITQVTQ